MSFFKKFVKKLAQIRKGVNQVKRASNELNGINRTLKSMGARKNKPSINDLNEVKVTGKRR